MTTSRRRKLAALLALLAAPALALLLAWLLAPGGDGPLARWARVREGMTEAEVVALMGPPGHHGVAVRPGGGGPESRFAQWEVPPGGGTLLVYFGVDGRVVSKRRVEAVDEEGGFLSRVRELLFGGPPARPITVPLPPPPVAPAPPPPEE